ncbi:hypothetical protein MTP99_005968 [Tenebrio molitor]|nr:hypothetical protein MTP99_005968 [Tenebrio molitor]
MIMYTVKVRNFPDVKETQTKLVYARRHSGPSINSTAKLLPKLISSRRHSCPSINSTAKLLQKLISARKHSGPSINGTLATANTASHYEKNSRGIWFILEIYAATSRLVQEHDMPFVRV